LNYANVEDGYSKGPNLQHLPDNVLVGNSASPFNNHLDAFEALSAMNLDGRQVVTPLSYGDAKYRDFVIAEGRRLLGSNFVPLLDFLPLDEYTSVMATCGIVVMNHVRQQGLGNVATALHQGARVFLNHRSPLFHFLHERGAVVNSLREMTPDGSAFQPLSPAGRAANRTVVEREWSSEVVQRNTSALIQTLKVSRFSQDKHRDDGHSSIRKQSPRRL